MEFLTVASVLPASKRSPHLTSRKRSSQIIGWLAEELAAQWLLQQGAVILQRRWHCRWGELDLVAQLQPNAVEQCSQSSLAFVEVKARRDGNWDMDGLLAITSQKQQKLWKTAELFLSEHPQLADLPCRFDAALVHVRSSSSKDAAKLDDRDALIKALSNGLAGREPIEIGKPITLIGYSLSLQHYIQSAFDLT